MADFEIKEPREFSTSIRKHERTDHANSNLFNAIYEVLINNDAFLYEVVETLSSRLAEELSGVVPITRTVNNKPLSSDISLTANDVAAIPTNAKGIAGGVAELDSTGKVLAAQLPSFVDDVVEGYLSGGKMYKEAEHTTVITGESGKIYIDLHTSKTYRWSGTTYIVISDTIALGETSATAYRGDRGKTAYDHSQAAHAPANAEQNVQADWKVSDASSDAYIKNKPTIPAAVAVKGNAETSYRTGNVNLTPANIGALAAANVVNNLAATAAGYALDARQGKALNDKITSLSSNLSGMACRVVNEPWNYVMKIPLDRGIHGLLCISQDMVYLIWVAGNPGAWQYSIKPIIGATSSVQIGINKTTGELTVNPLPSPSYCGITYIGK